MTGRGRREDGTVDTLGGYRLVRKLGAGSSAEVWLGSDGSTTVAIKVFRSDVELTRIDSEIDALARASHRHLLRLDDLTTGPDGRPCLILQRLTAKGLGYQLARRQLSPGEAVTVLAPLAMAVAELHRLGVAHGAVTPSSVLFDESGAPVLARFGSAAIIGDLPEDAASASLSPARFTEEARVAADLDGLVAVCRLALGEDGTDVTRWMDHHAPELAPHTFARELADRLFALAEPAPVCLSAGDSGFGRGKVRSRIDPPEESGLPPDFVDVPEPVVARHVHSEVMGALSAARAQIAALLRPVRKPVWIVAAGVAVAIVAFAAIAPTGDSSGSEVPIETSQGQPTGGRPATAHADPAHADPAIAGAEPIAAGTALLHARAACFDARSVLCLDGVDQLGSSAMEADSYRIRVLQSGGVPDHSLDWITDSATNPSAELVLSVVERIGDTALLSVGHAKNVSAQSEFSPTASLLIIRGDDGWRIRDIIPADASAVS